MRPRKLLSLARASCDLHETVFNAAATRWIIKITTCVSRVRFTSNKPGAVRYRDFAGYTRARRGDSASALEHSYL